MLENDAAKAKAGSRGESQAAEPPTDKAATDERESDVHVRFRVELSTSPGQELLLAGSSTQLGEFNPRNAVKLKHEHPGAWTTEIVLPSTSPTLTYKYLLAMKDALSWEFGPERELELPRALASGGGEDGDADGEEEGGLADVVLVRDVFRPDPEPDLDIFTSCAFTRVIFRRENRQSDELRRAEHRAAYDRATVLGHDAVLVQLCVFAPRVEERDELCIVGSTPDLGDGDEAAAVVLNDTRAPVWSVSVPLHPDALSFSYALFTRRRGSAKKEDVVAREAGEMHKFALSQAEKDRLSRWTAMVCTTAKFNYDRPWRGSGVAVPVFSLRSESSVGVGDFVDLRKTVDFCVRCGFQLLQLLPINDTTVHSNWRDSYPYSAISNFALHPLYLNLEEIGKLPASVVEEIRAKRKELEAHTELDYTAVIQFKQRIIRKLYSLQKSECLVSRDFQEFFRQNQHWLVPYALFRFFLDVNGTADYERWGNRTTILVSEMEQLAAPDTFHFDYIGVTYFVQYHLHRQLRATSEYAAKHQVVLKGDLPIGVNRHCTDTWINPHLFRLHMQAGAPPDMFSKDGQNWGFPTYDWDEMAKDDYAWWRARLRHMSNYFHAFRIDHVLGFFRIWEIPEQFMTGMSGRFFKSRPIPRDTLSRRGLWDMDRYLSPYVHDALLSSMFGNNMAQVKERFFEGTWGNRLKFREQYATERKLAAALEAPEGAAKSERQLAEAMRRQLFGLMNNVLLLADVADPNVYHPRFALKSTSSFHELPDNWKTHFIELHDDYFFKAQEELWTKEGSKKLPVMKEAGDMLVCAEDLGLVPQCVPRVMEENSILGLRVQRMPVDAVEFADPKEYPYTTVATLSTHDTTTFREWYEEMDTDARERYTTRMLRLNGPVPSHCDPSIVKRALEQQLASPSILCILPLQDIVAIDGKLRLEDAAAERINDPSNPDHFWRFRFHLRTDELLANEEFLERWLELNRKNGRGLP